MENLYFTTRRGSARLAGAAAIFSINALIHGHNVAVAVLLASPGTLVAELRVRNRKTNESNRR